MRTNGEMERDARMLGALKSIADSLKTIANALAAMNAKRSEDNENKEQTNE